MHRSTDHPQVIAPPPLIYVGALALGYLTRRVWSILSFHPLVWVGSMAIGVSVAIALWAVLTMHRAHTPVDPSKPPQALVQQGPFRWSRNPIYVALTVGSLGVALIWGNGWMIVWLIAAIIIMHYGVIRREERYLLEKFGAPYERYLQQVRRWL